MTANRRVKFWWIVYFIGSTILRANAGLLDDILGNRAQGSGLLNPLLTTLNGNANQYSNNPNLIRNGNLSIVNNNVTNRSQNNGRANPNDRYEQIANRFLNNANTNEDDLAAKRFPELQNLYERLKELNRLKDQQKLFDAQKQTNPGAEQVSSSTAIPLTSSVKPETTTLKTEKKITDDGKSKNEEFFYQVRPVVPANEDPSTYLQD